MIELGPLEACKWIEELKLGPQFQICGAKEILKSDLTPTGPYATTQPRSRASTPSALPWVALLGAGGQAEQNIMCVATGAGIPKRQIAVVAGRRNARAASLLLLLLDMLLLACPGLSAFGRVF